MAATKAKAAKKPATSSSTTPAPAEVPLVEYLKLGSRPYLQANECTSCGARFFDRRNACANCFGTSFKKARVKSQGIVKAFTIVTFAAPGVPVPFVSAVVDCDGTSVRANLVNVEPTPEQVKLGMKVKLTTYPMGTDSAGTECIAFGYEPA